ncbi:TylF/MycF/NovP-related O-methyltransferase [Afipia birgiae]|uniref:TylF/MycF/NovP-related O-methyltransferase n=1 Tax=Afipia birgiae TaxID=151414 RepID=UPI0002FAA195|nr:TylF/MycF/NovP-related O-methyltransferase [Afipia birgiae]
MRRLIEPRPNNASLPDIPEGDRETIRSVKDYTMTSAERIHAVCEAARYIEANNIPGAIVECGVWRGGSMMALARTLLSMNAGNRELFLFDTFDGMSSPDDNDVSLAGERASELIEQHTKSESDLFWCYAPLEAVKQAVLSTGYPEEKVNFVKGRVEETLPGAAPEQIALLRLDTDWYESTRHELETLYPRLVRGGVLILDDYGHWQGARKAVDEYIERNSLKLFLSRTDYTGRVAIKAFE